MFLELRCPIPWIIAITNAITFFPLAEACDEEALNDYNDPNELCLQYL